MQLQRTTTTKRWYFVPCKNESVIFENYVFLVEEIIFLMNDLNLFIFKSLFI